MIGRWHSSSSSTGCSSSIASDQSNTRAIVRATNRSASVLRFLLALAVESLIGIARFDTSIRVNGPIPIDIDTIQFHVLLHQSTRPVLHHRHGCVVGLLISLLFTSIAPEHGRSPTSFSLMSSLGALYQRITTSSSALVLLQIQRVR